MEQTKVCLDKALEAENEWVQISTRLLKKEEIEKGDAIASPAYHASKKTPTHGLPALCAMLPLFYEKTATPAMKKHGMDIVKQATNLRLISHSLPWQSWSNGSFQPLPAKDSM